MAGSFQDKDGDGKVAWYPSFAGEKPPAGASTKNTEDATKDKPASTGTGTSSTSTATNTDVEYTPGLYKIPGLDTEQDTTGVGIWLNKQSATTIKSYQSLLASLGRYKGPINGKVDADNKLLSGIIDALQFQVIRGATGKNESIASAIKAMGAKSDSSADTTPRANVTSKAAATAEMQNSFKEMFGIVAPTELVTTYLKDLENLELSRTSKTKTVKGVEVSTYGVSEQERKDLLNKYITTFARTNISAAATGDVNAKKILTNGKFGLTYTSLRGAYADNGIPITDKTLSEQVLDAAVNPQKLESIKNLINLQAKTYFPALANQIDAGYSVKQLLSPYLQSRANILEEDPDTIDLKELQSIAKDPKGLTGLYDYEISLRSNPKWRFTKNAQDSMAKVASSLAETFGLVG